MVCRVLHIIMRGEHIHIALGSNFHPPKECDPTIACLPESKGATMKSKKGASSKRNPRDGMLNTTCSYTR